MAGRASIYPTATGPTNAQLTKQKQLSQLASRLNELNSRMEALDRQVVTAAGHAERMKDLGLYHGAFFMAASRTLSQAENEEERS